MLSVLTMTARVVMPDEANAVASEFMNSIELRSATATSSTLRPIKAPGVVVEAANSPYYIFNRGENEGFVIISGDDRAPKILGYSDKGSFDAENLPPQLKEMMEQWAKQISEMPEIGKHASWSTTTTTRAEEGVLLETANWGQGYPYNALCPIIEGEQAPAGCVATAMAIAMKYHNWPDYTRGDAEEDFECKGVSFDFSDYVIDWDVLSDQNNINFAQEVSKLILSAGVAAQMTYGSMASYAYDWPYAHKMVEKYSYSKGCQYIERRSFTDSEWLSILQNQLTEVGPVIYRGSSTVGHAFIIDGYDGGSLYHVNWGWDGLMNGYYTLDFSDMGFDQFHGMVINIVPDKERHIYSKAFVPNVDTYPGGLNGCGDWNFMNPDIVPGEKNRIRLPDLCMNLHKGAFGIAVVDEEDNILQILDGFTYNDGYRYVCPWPGSDDAFDIVFPELKEGERFQLVSSEIDSEIFPGYVPVHEATKNPEDWQIVLGGIVRPSHFYMSGNRSEICEVNFHIDEKLPHLFNIHSKVDDEFTVMELKGHCCPDNVTKPRKGVSMEVKCYDKEGNVEIPVYSEGDADGSDILSFNISMYSDKYDVYLKYVPDADTRKVGDLPVDSIVEKDGLVFRVRGDKVSLIGYGEVSENLIIPDFVYVGDKRLPVVEIENDALLHAPIKELTILSSNLEFIGNCAFAGIDKLSTVEFQKARYNTFYNSYSFLKSPVKNVYSDSYEISGLLTNLICITYYSAVSTPVIGNNNIDFFISALPDNFGDYNYVMPLSYINDISTMNNFEGKVMNSFNIPGLGDPYLESAFENFTLPIKQMWRYQLDKKNGLLSLSDVIDNVIIDSVVINGTVVEKNNDNLYAFPMIEIDGVDVLIKYTVNGSKKMESHYSSDYNAVVENSPLVQKVESIKLTPDKWDGVEGETFRIEAVVMPEDATDKSLTWTSSDEAIATVDTEGNVSVLKEGTCVITATAADGSGVSAECIITSVAGVDGIFSAEESFDIYGVNGILIKKDADRDGLKFLTPGIYLIRQGGEVKKMVINN